MSQTQDTSQTIPVQIKAFPHYEGLALPHYQTEHSSGMDLLAAIDEPITLGPGERTLIPTGIAISLPAYTEAQIRPRSGLALKHGITCLNTPGTIDADYRGEIKVIIANLGSESFTFERGMRIAQMVIASVIKANLTLVDNLDETVRGSGGFGHTGI